MRLGTIFCKIILIAMFSSCAGEQRAESPNPTSAAVYGVEHHYLNTSPEERPYVPMDFYYKKCSVDNVGARAGIGRSFDCSDP